MATLTTNYQQTTGLGVGALHNIPVSERSLLTCSSEFTSEAVNPGRDPNEQIALLYNFASTLLSNTKDLDPKIAQAIDEKFWDLYEPF